MQNSQSLQAGVVGVDQTIEDSLESPKIDFNKFRPTRSRIASRKRKDAFMRVLIFLSFIVALIPLLSLLFTTIANGIKRLNLDFLTHNMTYVVCLLYTSPSPRD